MRSKIKAIAAGFAVLFCVSAAAPERIEYTLTPVMQDGARVAVQYELRFRGEGDGESSLRLPNSWGGQDELWRGIDALRVVSGAEMRDGETPDQRVLTHRPGARIHIRYRVVQDWEGAPRAELGNSYRPVVQPTYFHLIGDASLVTPGGGNLDAPVRFRVRNLPRGWSFASDLEHEGFTLGDVWSSVTVGGDFRVLRDANTKVRVAIRGDWRFADAEFMREAVDIIAAQRAFWGDGASPYLVTVLHLDGPENWLSVGGTGLNDAFAFFATANSPAETITRTLAHESLHSWIPAQIGGMPDEGEAEHYWLSEGFTDFYTARLLVRAGLWTPREFAADLNGLLDAYSQSSVRAEPNTRVLVDFWNDQEVQKLPYQRGRLLATVWDARLRTNGRNFDDVILMMRERARHEETLAVGVLADVAPLFGLEVSGDVVAHVDAGRPILLPEDAFAPCGQVLTDETPRFHRGFDITATQADNNIIAGVDPALPAYAAGLRDGMVLLRRDGGQIGDAEQEIAYVVHDGGAERTIRYMPRGHGAFTRQRLELAEDLRGARLEQCVAVIGGG